MAKQLDSCCHLCFVEGGRFSFYFDAGRTWLESVQSFRAETVPKLLAAGFMEVQERVFHGKRGYTP